MEPRARGESVYKLCRSGFGLVEVLIAAAIMAVIGIAFSQLLISGMKGQGAVTSNSDINNLQQTVQLIIQSPAACNANFLPGVYTFNPAGIVNAVTYTPGNPKIVPPQFNQIVFVDGTPALTYNQIYGNYKVTGLELRITANNGPNLYNALIHIELTNQQQVLGANMLSRDVPVGLNTTGAATIQGCGLATLPPVISTWNMPAWCGSPLPAGCSSAGGTWTWLVAYAAFAPSDLQLYTGSGALDGTAPWPMVPAGSALLIYGGAAACYNGVAWCFRN